MLIALLVVEIKENIIGKLIFKPALSALFVLVAWVQPSFLPSYTGWICAGLLFSWLGDLFLIFASKELFLGGLVSFLLGHVCYVAGFYSHGTWHLWGALATLVFILISLLVFFWLRPHLGSMKVPVMAYIIVITAMVSGALSMFFTPGHQANGRWCILIGAVCFYLSDIFVARDRFVSSGYENRLLGLPPYYLAQFLLAFSIGTI